MNRLAERAAGGRALVNVTGDVDGSVFSVPLDGAGTRIEVVGQVPEHLDRREPRRVCALVRRSDTTAGTAWALGEDPLRVIRDRKARSVESGCPEARLRRARESREEYT